MATVKVGVLDEETLGKFLPGRSSGGGHDNPHQYSCLENCMDRGGWQATVHGVTESDTPEVTYHAHRKVAVRLNT